MRSTFYEDDVKLLLKDITGLVTPLSAVEREPLIQSGIHYCQMLPKEYSPTDDYNKLFYAYLDEGSLITANAVANLSKKIVEKYGSNITLVSLARAGIPAGILIKRYLKYKYNIDAFHYAVSIIRDMGIDRNAIKYILNHHEAKSIVFVDGWTGKGAIKNELDKELINYPEIPKELAVLADPANITELAGTYEDILIPSSAFNCTISGLISRTFYRDDIILENDFHGSAYYGEFINEDKTYEFINKVVSFFPKTKFQNNMKKHQHNGIDEVKEISKLFNISNINFIKPGIGETTRVLLRRIPWLVIVNENTQGSDINHILQLAKEKNVQIKYYPLKNYRTCGIIKNIADI